MKWFKWWLYLSTLL